MTSLCFCFINRTEKVRWIDAVNPKPSTDEDTGEKVYEEWGELFLLHIHSFLFHYLFIGFKFHIVQLKCIDSINKASKFTPKHVFFAIPSLSKLLCLIPNVYILCILDCPQVQAIHSYQAEQPDELTLREGDVIKVLRKLPDGKH